jgi:DNA repair protein RecO (recombination protein O)
MKQFVSEGIVLRRTNYGEADRILNIITPNHGKISAIAKGVRKSGSKIAGGIELLSVNEISFMGGRTELHSVRSSRSVEQFHDILLDIDRTNFAYEVLKRISQFAEQITEPEVYEVCVGSLRCLSDNSIDMRIIVSWFYLRIADLSGRGINLQRDIHGQKLVESERYKFDIAEEGFVQHKSGEYSSNHLKLLKLIRTYTPDKVKSIGGISEELLQDCVYVSRLLVD